MLMSGITELDTLLTRLRERAAAPLEEPGAGRISPEELTCTGRLAGDAVQLGLREARRARACRERERARAALRRHAQGRYGRCVRCGGAIEAGRLRADPAAPECAACARRAARGAS